MKKLLLFVLFSCFSTQNGFTQNNLEVKQLKKEIYSSKIDSNKIKAAFALSSYYQNINVDTSLFYAKICEEFLKNTVNAKFEIQLLVLLSQLYTSYGREDYTLEHLLKALSVATKSRLNPEIAKISDNIANFYQGKSFPKVIEYYISALNAAKLTKNNDLIIEILGSGSNYYFNVGEYDKSKDIIDEQIKLNPAISDEKLDDYGDIFRAKKDFKTAAEYYFKAIKIYEDKKDSFRLIFLYHNYSLIPELQKQYDEAIKYLVISKNLADKLNVDDYVAKVNAELAKIYLEKKEYQLALKYNLEAIQYYSKKEESVETKNLIKVNAEINFNLGNFKEAYKELNTFIEMENAQNLKGVQSKITLLESSILLDRKQNEIELLNKDKEIQRRDLERQKTRIVFAIIGLILAFVFTVFILRLLKIRNKQNKIIEEQRSQSDALLLNILPAEVAKELKETGTAKAKRYEMATVLFTDFKNFTNLSENLSPEELVSEINYCYSEFDKIITKHGIEKIKTIGDSYMCAGGLPTKNETNPFDAVNAGLELQEFMIKHKESRVSQNKPFFELRLGIHTGIVVAGIVGVKKFAYDIWGDAVNTASRMESSGEVGKVNISEATYNLVKDKFDCVHRGKVEAKNKGEIDMYFVEKRILI